MCALRLLQLGIVLFSLEQTVSAQTAASVPAGYLTIEGSGASVLFGSLPSMRCQVLSRDFRGLAATIKQVDCRRDGGRDASPYHFLGRSWSNVQLTMGEGDFAAASPTFSANLRANIMTVFRGSVTWPDHSSGAPTNRPHTWGTDIAFPFQSPWAYSGNADITMDFVLTGGMLTNGSIWAAGRPYYVDGIHSPAWVGGSSFMYGTNNCLNAPHLSAPFCVPVMRTYAVNTGDPGTSNRFTFQWWFHGFPPSTPTALALSFAGTKAGVNIGNPCQNYHIGPSIVMFAVTPRDNSRSWFAPNPPLKETYSPTSVGMNVWTQAGYSHPTRNRLELTRPGMTTILAQPKPPLNAAWTHAPSAASTTGSRISAEHLPLLRLSR